MSVRYFHLLDPNTYENIGLYTTSHSTASPYRAVALKAANRGHKNILIRESKQSLIKQFKGKVKKLKTPIQTQIGGQTIIRKKQAEVEYVSSFRLE